MSRAAARLAVAAVAAAVVALATVAPAQARIRAAEITHPADNPTWSAASQVSQNPVPVSGRFEVDAGTRELELLFRSLRGAQNRSGRHTITTNRFTVPSPSLPWNGSYELTATFANHDERSPVFGGCGSTPCVESKPVLRFLLAVPPATPGGVKAQPATAGRVVTVTWAANVEPDLAGYYVLRKVDAGDYEEVGAVEPAPQPSFTDEDLPEAGGKVTYAVVAVRQGARFETDGDVLLSEGPGTSETLTVEPAPTTSTQPGSSTTTPGKPGTTTSIRRFGSVVTAAPATTATTRAPLKGPDLRAFAAELNRRNAAPTTTADPGFDRYLPFQAGDEVELVEEEASPYRPAAVDEGPPALKFVAAALQAAMLAALALWLRRQVNQPGDAVAAQPLALAPVPAAGRASSVAAPTAADPPTVPEPAIPVVEAPMVIPSPSRVPGRAARAGAGGGRAPGGAEGRRSARAARRSAPQAGTGSGPVPGSGEGVTSTRPTG